MQYILERLREGSTWAGIAGIIGTGAAAITDTINAIAPAISALASAILIFMPTKRR